jgi:PAS domain S-box-containing protein
VNGRTASTGPIESADPLPHPIVRRRQLHRIIAAMPDGIILAEPDGSIAWANAAALVMHGCDSAAGLGGTPAGYRDKFALRFRNNHHLDQQDYPLDRLLAGEEFSNLVVEMARQGSTRFDRVCDLDGLILRDGRGEDDVLALTIRDRTEEYEAEERFERTFNANPAPAVICGLNDLRYVKVNQGFVDMTGYVRAEIIGRSVYELDVLEAAAHRDQAIRHLREGRTIPQMEAVLRLPAGGAKSVIVAGQPIEMLDEPCMLFTFMDLEPRKQAEASLRQSEARFAAVFRLSPVPTLLFRLGDYSVIEVNDAFAATFGHAAANAFGLPLTGMRLWADEAARRAFEVKIAAEGRIRGSEAVLRCQDDGMLNCLISADIVSIGGETCGLCVMQDITERKRNEEELVAAIEAVMQDTSWFSRSIIEKLAVLRNGARHGPGEPELAGLTARERQVLELVAAGQGNDEIALGLGVTRNTLRNYLAAIYAKLDIHSRGDAIVWARERGLVPRRKA